MVIVNGEGRMKLTFVSSSGIGGVKRAEETWQNDGLQVVKACQSTEIKALMTSAGDCQTVCWSPETEITIVAAMEKGRRKGQRCFIGFESVFRRFRWDGKAMRTGAYCMESPKQEALENRDHR